MHTIDIFDALFKNSISMAGERADWKPKHFHWDRNPELPRSPLFFSDAHIDRVVDYSGSLLDCYAILIEPEVLHPGNYQRALRLEDHFDGIFTHDARFAERDRWHLYPFGGSWIADAYITRKTLDVGIIASHKKSLPGHKLRHKIVRHLLPDAWGSGYKPFDTKRRILADYRFMVIVENVRQDYWFTEKLLDALSMGCIPIYWGCPSIGKFFNTDGIIQFETYDDLRDILFSLDFQTEYLKRSKAVLKNAELAKQFYICEDVLHDAYPTVFGNSYNRQ